MKLASKKARTVRSWGGVASLMGPRPALVILTLWLLCPGGWASAAESVDQSAYRQGLQAVAAGDYAKADQLFTRAIASNPGDFRYYNDRGIARKARGDLENALSDYSKCLELKPGYANALNNRGLIRLQRGEYDKAVEDFDEALKQGEFLAKIRTNLGLAKAGKGESEAALKEFQMATALRPADPRAFYFLAQTLDQMGDREKALKMYQVALGVIKNPAAEEVIEKRLTELEKDVRPSQPRPPAPAPAPQAPKAAEPPASIAKQTQKQIPGPTAVGRDQRRVVRAPSAPMAVSAAQPPVAAKTIAPLPETLDELNNRSRERALTKFSPNAAEIYRQGRLFADQADTRKALIRFEDAFQLEKRSKNTTAAAWSMLEIGRIYLKIGDRLKALNYLESAQRIFERLKATDEIVLTLVELAAVRKAAGQNEYATKALSDAAREAAASGNKQVAAVLGDMAAGRTPPVAKKRAHTEKAATPAASVEPQAKGDTAEARMALVKKDHGGPPAPADIKQKAPQPVRPQVAEEPAQLRKGPMRWGKSEVVKAEPVAKPAVTPKDAGLTKTEVRPPAPEVKRAPHHLATPLPTPKPAVVETRVGGEPAAVRPKTVESLAPAPRVARAAEPPRERESGDKKPSVETPWAPKLTPSVASVASPPLGSIPYNKREAATKRINADLAELRKNKNSGEQINMIVTLERLAKRYAMRREYEKALHGLTASLAIREKMGLEGSAANLYVDRAFLRKKTGDPFGALEDLTKALALSETRGQDQDQGEAETRTRVAALVEELGLDSSATMAAFEDLWKARAAADGKAETEALHRLGRLYDKAGKPAQALNYYERSSASLLVDKARMYERMGKRKQADDTYEEALQAFKKLDYSRYLSLLKKGGVDPAPPSSGR